MTRLGSTKTSQQRLFAFGGCGVKVRNRVYWLATERLKVSNPELGFVSANNWDGVAAVSAGLRTFWIQRTTAEVPEELGFQVDVTVKAITELPELLRA